eukprot:jgi/Bigna1/87657/estExt_fgenesh1_pg.C_220193
MSSGDDGKETLYLAMVDYYCQKELYGTVRKICKQVGALSPIFRFWEGYATAMQGNPVEAIRELSSIPSDATTNLAVTACLIHAHKLCEDTDKSAVSKLKVKLRDYSKSTEGKGLLIASRFFWHTGKEKQAKMCVEKVIAKNRRNLDALALFGWICMTSDNPRQVKRSVTFFSTAIKMDAKHLPSLAGRARHLASRNDYAGALADINQMIVSHPGYKPGLVAKANVMIAQGDWEEAMRVHLLNALTQSSAHNAASQVDELKRLILDTESQNHSLLCKVSMLVARIAGKQTALLRASMKLANRAIVLDSTNPAYPAELAFQVGCLRERLSGNPKSALDTYSRSLQADESYVPALHGRIRCKIELGMLKEADEELEFMGEVTEEGDVGAAIDLGMLKALLAWRLHKDDKKTLKALDALVKTHAESLEGCEAGSAEFYIKYNPGFVMEVVDMLLNFVSPERLTSYDPPSQNLKRCKAMLQQLTHLVPGFLHILLARIYLANEAHKEAEDALAQALSLDFEIKTKPIYYVLKAKILEERGQTEQALELLKKAFALPGVRKTDAKKRKGSAVSSSSSSSSSETLSVSDRMSVFIDMAACLSKLNKLKEAQAIMDEARKTFHKAPGGTDHLTLAEGTLCLKRRDVKRALAVLKTIRASSELYMTAKVKMAEIYLNHRKQKHLYVGCYRELAQKHPTLHNRMLLGKAYMRIQEPEKAIETYEAARKAMPDQDSKLSRVIGSALAAMHDYTKACQYYETAVHAAPEDLKLAADLATLYRRLTDFDSATRVVMTSLQAYEGKSKAQTEDDLIAKVRLYRILADISRDAEDQEGLIASLQKARHLQKTILNSGRGAMTGERLREQTKVATELCYDLGNAHSSDLEASRQFYDLALQHDEGHKKSLITLAKISLAQGEVERCEQQCAQLLQVDPDNKEALSMLADIIFRKGELDSAAKCFQQLLQRCPTEFNALSRLIDLLSYTSEPHQALTAFNHARLDSKWGAKAIEQMIKIYLDPGHNGVFAKAAEAKGDDSMSHVGAAEKLIQQLSEMGGDPLKISVLQAYCLMATREKPSIERAVESLRRLLSGNDARAKDYVPAYVAIGNGYVLLNKLPKAKGYLKRLTRPNEATFQEFQDDYVEGWLLLVEIHIQNGKNDMAARLCQKCIQTDRSCNKAWERLGHIKEKETAYKDAAENYEWAWKYSKESSPAIGYKLAFNYLKADRLVDAIDVCNKVLEKYPGYPKIRKEVLNKARSGLRP